MENNRFKSDEQSFLRLSQQREQNQRLKALFDDAVGEEEISLRDENVKHFNLGANRHQAVVYSEPVHFRNSEGAWQEIDNTLEEAVTAQGRRVLRNRASRLQVEFPQRMDGGSMASITENGRTFAWRFEQEAQPVQAVARTGAQLKQERLVARAQAMPKFVGRTVESLRSANLAAEIETAQEQRGDIAQLKAENTYESVLPGVSVRYTVMSNRVKEDIILANAEALSRTVIRLPKAFDYEVTDAAELLVKDVQSGETVFMMDTPLVYDAAGKETLAAVELTDMGEYVRMEYRIDPLFMNDAVYPVTIDPVIHSTNAVHNIQDTTLGEGQSAKPYTADHLKIGKYSGTLRCVGLLQFETLAIPPAGNTIIGAVLRMHTMSGSTSNVVAAYEVLKPWESANVNWLNFDPDDTSNVSDQALECVPGKSSGWLSFDLTNLYRKWITRNAAGVSNNNGVAFRTPNNMSGNNYTQLHSSDASNTSYRPVMYVNYISHAGLEGWWQYEQMSAGRAGTVYTDLFNGNMVLEHSDTAMSGNRMPVSVNHYYNSCRSDVNGYHCGFGWKTDAHQKITAQTLNDTNYFVWEDGDGTEHYFPVSGSQPYKDVEGMDMELTYTSGSPGYAIITDKEHNQMRFDVVKNGLAWLVAARDACNNMVTYSYVSGHEEEGRLDKITDPVGRITQFSYDASGRISNIRIPAAASDGYRYIYYTYDSANRLTGIRYGELEGTAPHTVYAYSGDTALLTSARNYDGVQVNVGYESLSYYGVTTTDSARRVLSAETVAVNAAGEVLRRGAKQLFNYETMCTEVTAVDTASSDSGKKLYYQFNASGNVVCVRDELGYARFTKFDSGIENKPSAESSLRRAVVNILRHPDFSANWSANGTAVKDASVTCLNAPSVKLTANGGSCLYRQEVTLEGGKKYTLSAYAKCQNVDGIFGTYVRLSKKSNPLDCVTSTGIYGTTEGALNNGMAADGWERVCVTLDRTNITGSEAYYAELVLASTGGTAWFACPQLEEGGVMNHVNLLSNSDFRYTAASGTQILPLDWTKASNVLTSGVTGVHDRGDDPSFPDALSGKYLAIEGVPNKAYVGFVQAMDLSGKAGDLFTLGGWMNSRSVPFGAETKVEGRLALLLRFKKSSGSWSDYLSYDFNSEWVGWQFACFAAAAPNDYTQVEMSISYLYNCNVSEFTNFFLYREAFGESFAYDSDKNLVSTGTLSGQKSDIKYDSAKNINVYTQPGRDSSVGDNQHWFYYGGSDAEKKKHLLLRSRTPMHVTDYYSYDSYGNTTASRRLDYRVFTGSTADNAYPYIRTETAYTSDGNFTASTKDARGNTVTQAVNTNDGTLTSVTDPNGQTVNYSYDASKRVTEVQTVADGKTYKNAYTYENDRIKTVAHNTTGDTADVTYTFDYDAMGRKTTVKVGSQTLSTNVYEDDRNGLLSEVQYGNGGKVSYAYDGYDRLTGVKYDGESAERYTYQYGANGQASEVKDANLGRTTRTDYDLADRPCQVEVRNDSDGSLMYRTRLKYDKLGNLERFAENVGTETHETAYAYDRDNRVTALTYDGDTQKVSYGYDELGRVTTRTAECGAAAGKLTSTYTYIDGGFGTNSTTPLVKKITQNGISFEYEYDSRGNIVSEKRGNLTTTYAYDALGQLIRVNDPHENATWVYNYDRGGNILSKAKYAYTTGTLGTAVETIPYTYGDSNWKDKLTAYNGTAITYDAIGNPLNDGAWTFTWAAGRQLKKMVREDRTLDFKYNHNGMRIQKVLQHDWYPETTNYTYHGKLLTHMEVEYYDFDEVKHTDKLHFFYDGTGCLTQLRFKSLIYTYVQNSQGDVVGILDSTGALVVEYKYDAWGKLLSTTGSLADTLGERNPFRYRGYIYDEESELYYLHTRYYTSVQGRFISPDQMENTDAEIFSENRFAYCKNNPGVQRDSDGTLGLFAIGAIVGAVAGFVGQVVSDVVTSVINREVTVSSWQTYVGATLGGAASGVAFVATGGNPAVATKVSSAVSGGVTTLTSGVLEKLTNDDYDQTWGEIMANTALDTAVGFAVSYVDIRIPRVTSGRNSMSAVYRSGLTKLRNGTAQNMSQKVVAKGVASMATASLAMDTYYGVKQAIYGPIKTLLKKKDRSIGNLRGPKVYSVIK